MASREAAQAQVELQKAQRMVRDSLPRWASWDQIQQAQMADPTCRHWLAEATSLLMGAQQ